MCERAGFALTPVIDLSTGRSLGADGGDRMGVFLMRRPGLQEDPKAAGAHTSEEARSVTFEDLLFLGMGDLCDSDDDGTDNDLA